MGAVDGGDGVAEVVLFHHVQGLTEGVLAFAEHLPAAGHTVYTPDLFNGARPPTIKAGVALTEKLGDAELNQRADRAVTGLSAHVVYAGFSFGAPRHSASHRRGPAARVPCCTRRASPSPGRGRLARGAPGCPSRSMAWTATPSSRLKGIGTPRGNWWPPSAPARESYFCIPATAICLPTARSLLAAPMPEPLSYNDPSRLWSAWDSSATGWRPAQAAVRAGAFASGPQRKAAGWTHASP